ncbi:hypothetical protein CBR_g34887 [Chara braunii]|uniref:Uncharacterized protein n=1 Tax=Chara braunii TaxID=69332 RepID=A0A388LJK2_CHABU|nr:hypothetical protein CBR_g34887 [Chara braunii]|eukprot:GBG82510.1 hypothetical protein CBR_g34887 [Chara braunii]
MWGLVVGEVPTQEFADGVALGRVKDLIDEAAFVQRRQLLDPPATNKFFQKKPYSVLCTWFAQASLMPSAAVLLVMMTHVTQAPGVPSAAAFGMEASLATSAAQGSLGSKASNTTEMRQPSMKKAIWVVTLTALLGVILVIVVWFASKVICSVPSPDARETGDAESHPLQGTSPPLSDSSSIQQKSPPDSGVGEEILKRSMCSCSCCSSKQAAVASRAPSMRRTNPLFTRERNREDPPPTHNMHNMPSSDQVSDREGNQMHPQPSASGSGRWSPPLESDTDDQPPILAQVSVKDLVLQRSLLHGPKAPTAADPKGRSSPVKSQAQVNSLFQPGGGQKNEGKRSNVVEIRSEVDGEASKAVTLKLTGGADHVARTPELLSSERAGILGRDGSGVRGKASTTQQSVTMFLPEPSNKVADGLASGVGRGEASPAQVVNMVLAEPSSQVVDELPTKLHKHSSPPDQTDPSRHGERPHAHPDLSSSLDWHSVATEGKNSTATAVQPSLQPIPAPSDSSSSNTPKGFLRFSPTENSTPSRSAESGSISSTIRMELSAEQVVMGDNFSDVEESSKTTSGPSLEFAAVKAILAATCSDSNTLEPKDQTADGAEARGRGGDSSSGRADGRVSR